MSTHSESGEIHDAAAGGDLEKVKALLKDNPELVFTKDKDGSTPLHMAAALGHKAVTELLLANKAEVNAKNYQGIAPLHLAAVNNLKEVAELLLANKAEVNAKDNIGWTPLHLVVAQGHNKDVAELLRKHGGHE
jgi:ankyrin repeat protein